MSRKIVKREIRFAVHIKRTNYNDDCHYIKEQITYDDGTQEPNVGLVTDFQRPVWVTRHNARNHLEKRTFESMDNLAMSKATQSDLYSAYANLLGDSYLADHPRLLEQSPYVYGMGISAANIIKMKSLLANDGIQTPYSICSLDLETNMLGGPKEEIFVGSVVRKVNGRYQAHVAIYKDWVKHLDQIIERVMIASKRLIPEYHDILDYVFEIHDDQIGIIDTLFRKACEWKPDFMSIWNLEFDINQVVLPNLRKRGIRYADILSDPLLPKELRKFEFILAKNKRRDPNGRWVNIPNYDQWHGIDATLPFQIIDSMCSYRALRIAAGKDNSYKLDDVLHKELKTSKLKIPEVDHLTGPAWHIKMQEDFIPEYIVYNVIDNIKLIDLDEATGDLSGEVPELCGISSFNDFNLSAKKNHDDLFVYGLTKNMVIGTPTNMVALYEKWGKDNTRPNRDVYHRTVLDIKDWIQTLPQANLIRTGIRIFNDYEDLITNLRGNVGDADSVSSYPSCTMAGNVSSETTRSEIIRMEGINTATFRSQNLGIVLGNTNSLEYCEVMFKLPSNDEISDMIKSGDIWEYDY